MVSLVAEQIIIVLTARYRYRYKCYAAHVAQLYVSKDAQRHLRTLGHFFKNRDTLENLLGLAGASYELVASIPAVIQYLESLSWDAIADHEEKLQAILIDYLNSKPGVYQIYGEPVGKTNFLVHISLRDISSRLTFP